MTEDYFDIQAANWSSLKYMATSPKMLKFRSDEPRKDTPALEQGRAIHCAILEPLKWETTYVKLPDFGDLRTKAAKLEREEWRLSVPPGAVVLKTDVYDMAERCRDAVVRHPASRGLVAPGTCATEVTARWAWDEIDCKGRLDAIPADSPRVVDLKSTRRENLRQMATDIGDLLYHGQLAWYHDGAIAAGLLPHDAPPPALIFVQTVAPYDVAAGDLALGALEAGRALYRYLWRKYVDCRLANMWPGIAPDPITWYLPRWAPGVALLEETDAACGTEADAPF